MRISSYALAFGALALCSAGIISAAGNRYRQHKATQLTPSPQQPSGVPAAQTPKPAATPVPVMPIQMAPPPAPVPPPAAPTRMAPPPAPVPPPAAGLTAEQQRQLQIDDLMKRARAIMRRTTNMTEYDANAADILNIQAQLVAAPLMANNEQEIIETEWTDKGLALPVGPQPPAGPSPAQRAAAAQLNGEIMAEIQALTPGCPGRAAIDAKIQRLTGMGQWAADLYVDNLVLALAQKCPAGAAAPDTGMREGRLGDLDRARIGIGQLDTPCRPNQYRDFTRVVDELAEHFKNNSAQMAEIKQIRAVLESKKPAGPAPQPRPEPEAKAKGLEAQLQERKARMERERKEREAKGSGDVGAAPSRPAPGAGGVAAGGEAPWAGAAAREAARQAGAEAEGWESEAESESEEEEAVPAYLRLGGAGRDPQRAAEEKLVNEWMNLNRGGRGVLGMTRDQAKLQARTGTAAQRLPLYQANS